MNEIKVLRKPYKNGGGSYIVMTIDLGYTVIPLSYDSRQIAEILCITNKELNDIFIHSNDNDILYTSNVDFKPYKELQGLKDKN